MGNSGKNWESVGFSTTVRLSGGGDGLVFGMGDVHATVLADGDEVSMGYYGLLQVTMTYYDLP